MKNCHGQAVIEGLIISVIILPFFFLLIAGLYFVCADAAMDEFLEMHLQCSLEKKASCSLQTHQRIETIGIKINSFKEVNQPPEHSVSVEATLMKKWILKKKRSLFYETSISSF